jgi:hypothetical protein
MKTHLQKVAVTSSHVKSIVIISQLKAGLRSHRPSESTPWIKAFMSSGVPAPPLASTGKLYRSSIPSMKLGSARSDSDWISARAMKSDRIRPGKGEISAVF